jgi:N-alpha-acetyltransferase 40
MPIEEVGRYTKSSMGWDPPSKKQELFHRDSRFVLLRRSQAQAQDGLEHLHEELPILAYSMFRFDMEDDECVLYWYSRLSMSSHSS